MSILKNKPTKCEQSDDSDHPCHKPSLIKIYICALICSSYGPQREKTLLLGFANNTGADQPALPRSLISSFVIRFSESTICKRATSEFLRF